MKLLFNERERMGRETTAKDRGRESKKERGEKERNIKGERSEYKHRNAQKKRRLKAVTQYQGERITENQSDGARGSVRGSSAKVTSNEVSLS